MYADSERSQTVGICEGNLMCLEEAKKSKRTIHVLCDVRLKLAYVRLKRGKGVTLCTAWNAVNTIFIRLKLRMKFLHLNIFLINGHNRSKFLNSVSLNVSKSILKLFSRLLSFMRSHR